MPVDRTMTARVIEYTNRTPAKNVRLRFRSETPAGLPGYVLRRFSARVEQDILSDPVATTEAIVNYQGTRVRHGEVPSVWMRQGDTAGKIVSGCC